MRDVRYSANPSLTWPHTPDHDHDPTEPIDYAEAFGLKKDDRGGISATAATTPEEQEPS